MNTIVNREIVKLLKGKKIIKVCETPTIADVIMELHKTYGVWIAVDLDDDNTFVWVVRSKSKILTGDNFSTPTEAYQEALLETLKELV